MSSSIGAEFKQAGVLVEVLGLTITLSTCVLPVMISKFDGNVLRQLLQLRSLLSSLWLSFFGFEQGSTANASLTRSKHDGSEQD